MTQCCNTHLWCGGSSSYICALRMGGGRINLGLVLVKGSLKGYSVQRDLEQSSNDSGAFFLHPEDMHIRPGESVQVEWELFWFEDRADFRKKLASCPGFVQVEAERFLLFEGEKVHFRAFIGQAVPEENGGGTGGNDAGAPAAGNGADALAGRNDADVRGSGSGVRPVILRNGEAIDFSWKNGIAEVEEETAGTGEYCYEIKWMGKCSRARFLVRPGIWELAERRCRFIAGKQQCRDEKSCLNGAFLIYDNEEGCQYYNHAFPDHNAGRERIGMGVLLARYLQERPDEELERSLDAFVKFVRGQLLDEETGEVFNDAPRCQDWKRLYNYPWICVLFLEVFRLKKDRWYLQAAFRIMKAYYRDGGSHFYAIAIPMRESVELFRENGMEKEAGELLGLFREHADRIAGLGKHYPAHEVKYEQSIVAPAATYLCELYHLTGEEKYRKAAREQLEVLELFQGRQPDYHMYEVAIRHWDGYWFGKRACYGDTFPHYWSALTGVAFREAEKIEGCEAFAARAEDALRGTLSLFFEDGSASCACVYPLSVNRRPGDYFDPWANDQDWGLYFYLKYACRKGAQG